MTTFLDRDKLKLTLTLDNDVYIPGESIRGVLRVQVLKQVKVTALRLHVIAREKASVEVSRSGSRSKTASDICTHFEKLITFFGYSQESGRKGGATLVPVRGEDGQLQDLVYPFDIPLPPTAPPSFSVQFKSGGSMSLTYRIRAIAVIPNGFDGKIEQLLKVVYAIPQAQLNEVRNVPHKVDEQMVELPRKGCCNKDKNPYLAVSVSCPQLTVYDENIVDVRPPQEPPQQPPREARQESGAREDHAPTADDPNDCVLNQPSESVFVDAATSGVLSPNAPSAAAKEMSAPSQEREPTAPFSDDPTPAAPSSPMTKRRPVVPTTLPVVVQVRNLSSKQKVKNIRVTLKQYVKIECQGLSRAEVNTVSTKLHVFPARGLRKQESCKMELRLALGMSLCAFGYKEEKRSPGTEGIIAPALATRFVEVSNILEVTFPSTKTKDLVNMPDACWLVSAVDNTNTTQRVPVRFDDVCLLPETVTGGAMS